MNQINKPFTFLFIFFLTVLGVCPLGIQNSLAEEIQLSDRNLIVVKNRSINIQLEKTSSDGSLLHYRILRSPLYGFASIKNENYVFFSPAVNFIGTDSLVYEATADQVQSKTVTITFHILEEPPIYKVTAGEDQEIFLSNNIQLQGKISFTNSIDIINEKPTISWVQVTGPGQVQFDDSSLINPSVQFSFPGIYLLDLQVSLEGMTFSDQIMIVVKADALLPQHDTHPLSMNIICPSKGLTTATISYEPTESGSVSISVFDREGKKVREMIRANGVPGAPSSEEFEAGDLGSGIYHVIVEQGNTVLEKVKLVIIR